MGSADVPLVKSSTAGASGASGKARPLSSLASSQCGAATTTGSIRVRSCSSGRLGEAVVERRVADARPGGAEEARGHDRAVGLHEREPLGARAVDPVGDGAGDLAELLVGEAVGPVPEGETVAEGIGRHLEDHGDVHSSPPG